MAIPLETNRLNLIVLCILRCICSRDKLAGYGGAGGVHQAHHITLQIENVIIDGIIQHKGVRTAILVVHILHNVLGAARVLPDLPHQGAVQVIEVRMLGGVIVCVPRAQSIIGAALPLVNLQKRYLVYKKAPANP